MKKTALLSIILLMSASSAFCMQEGGGDPTNGSTLERLTSLFVKVGSSTCRELKHLKNSFVEAGKDYDAALQTTYSNGSVDIELSEEQEETVSNVNYLIELYRFITTAPCVILDMSRSSWDPEYGQEEEWPPYPGTSH